MVSGARHTRSAFDQLLQRHRLAPGTLGSEKEVVTINRSAGPQSLALNLRAARLQKTIYCSGSRGSGLRPAAKSCAAATGGEGGDRFGGHAGDRRLGANPEAGGSRDGHPTELQAHPWGPQAGHNRPLITEDEGSHCHRHGRTGCRRSAPHHRGPALPGPGPAPPLLFHCLLLAQTLSDSMPAARASGITVTTTPDPGA